ncbi:hypothetical protein D3C75_1236650 [compost metagenome]
MNTLRPLSRLRDNPYDSIDVTTKLSTVPTIARKALTPVARIKALVDSKYL